jgi:hypothetical protein
MTKPRPICVHCGKPYGQRHTSQEVYIWDKDAPRPQYRGNKLVVSDRVRHTAPHNTSGSWQGVKFGHNDNVADRSLWDGETWFGGYSPFCTLRCALEYARAAYKNRRTK